MESSAEIVSCKVTLGSEFVQSIDLLIEILLLYDNLCQALELLCSRYPNLPI